MTLKLVLDRYEENLCVCLDFDDKRYLIPKEILGDMKVNDIFNIEFDGKSFSNPALLKEETDKKKEDISQRMKKIFIFKENQKLVAITLIKIMQEELFVKDIEFMMKTTKQFLKKGTVKSNGRLWKNAL